MQTVRGDPGGIGGLDCTRHWEEDPTARPLEFCPLALGLTPHSLPGDEAAAVRDARYLTEMVIKDREAAGRLLQGFRGMAFLLWAPGQTEHASRMLTNVHCTLTAQALDLDILVLCERDAAPANSKPELLEDLFQHVALLPKWRHVMAGTWHLREPCTHLHPGQAGGDSEGAHGAEGQ